MISSFKKFVFCSSILFFARSAVPLGETNFAPASEASIIQCFKTYANHSVRMDMDHRRKKKISIWRLPPEYRQGTKAGNSNSKMTFAVLKDEKLQTYSTNLPPQSDDKNIYWDIENHVTVLPNLCLKITALQGASLDDISTQEKVCTETNVAESIADNQRALVQLVNLIRIDIKGQNREFKKEVPSTDPPRNRYEINEQKYWKKYTSWKAQKCLDLVSSYAKPGNLIQSPEMDIAIKKLETEINNRNEILKANSIDPSTGKSTEKTQ